MPHPAAMNVTPASALSHGVPCQSHAFSAPFHGNKCHGGPGHKQPSGRPVNTGFTPWSQSPCFLAKLSLLLPQSFWFLDVPVQSHSCIVSSPIETPLNVFILASAEICFVTKIWGHSHSQAEQSSGVTERTCIQAWWSLMLILCFRTLKEMTYQKPNEKHK